MESSLLTDLGIILVAATLVVVAARIIRIPSIVGYILAGLIAGPALGLVEVTEGLHLAAEIGIILLLFLVGLELSLGKIREVGGIALLVGLLQVVVTGTGVAAIAWAFGLSGGDVLFLGVALTFSSTVVVVKLLDQLRALDSRHGRLSVGVLLVQDLVVVVVLTFVAGLSGGVELSALEVITDLARAFGGMALLLLAAGIAARFILPRVFAWAGSSQETTFVWSLSWCFLLVLGSEWLHLSVELGAFIAGVAIAQLPFNHDLRRRVHPLMNFFVAVFFVTLGVQMELGAAFAAWPLVLTLIVATLLLKPPLIARLLRSRGEGPGTALRSGLTLGQTSEFSFILAALALANGLIDEDMLSVVAAVGLVTMGVSSFSILHADGLVEAVRKRGLLPLLTGASKTEAEEGDEAQDPGTRGHIVVVGMNSLGRRIVRDLAEAGEEVLAIDTDPDKLKDLPCRTLLGNADYLSLLEEAELKEAGLLVSALHIEDANRLLAYRAESFGIPCVIHAFDQSMERELEELGVRHLVNSRSAGIEKIADELKELGVFGE